MPGHILQTCPIGIIAEQFVKASAEMGDVGRINNMGPAFGHFWNSATPRCQKGASGGKTLDNGLWHGIIPQRRTGGNGRFGLPFSDFIDRDEAGHDRLIAKVLNGVCNLRLIAVMRGGLKTFCAGNHQLPIGVFRQDGSQRRCTFQNSLFRDHPASDQNDRLLDWLVDKPALRTVSGNANLCSEGVIDAKTIQKAVTDIGADTDDGGHIPEQCQPILDALTAFHVTRIIVQVKAHPQIWAALLDVGGNVTSAMHFHQIGCTSFFDLGNIIRSTANICASKPLSAWPQTQKSMIVERGINHRTTDAKTVAALARLNKVIHHA